MSQPSEGDDSFLPDATILHEDRYDLDSNRGLATPILEAVAVLEERPVGSFREDPIHETVDLEAAEALLFGPREDDVASASSREVTFEYRGYLIRIHGDSRIVLFDADDIEE